ncbi:Zinc finger protein ZAT9 [Bienertia sinuspersici]
MEKHRCKLCFRKFANGRALGGHMRSHMMNLPIPPKPKPLVAAINPSCETHQSSSTSSDRYHEEENRTKLVDHDSCSLMSLQDRESENESFKKKNNTSSTRRRRSKRKPSVSSTCLVYKQHYKYVVAVNGDDDDKKMMMNDVGNVNVNVNDMVEAEPVSCTSEVTSDEDLAFCLMMMSRDSWSSNKFAKYHNNDDDDDDDDDDGDNMVDESSTRMKKKYKCETCSKVFRSYQALGGHRASHKKNRIICENESCNFGSNKEDDESSKLEDELMLLQKKVHECPVCLRVFSSGQALGGHKRSHVLANNVNGVAEKSSPTKKMMMMISSSSNYHANESLIDLNLPAPVEDEDDGDEEISDDRIAVSAVSDVHF